MTLGEKMFEAWWQVYGKQPPKMDEDHVNWVKDAWLAAWTARGKRDVEIAKHEKDSGDCPAGCRCYEMRERIATAIAQED